MPRATWTREQAAYLQTPFLGTYVSEAAVSALRSSSTGTGFWYWHSSFNLLAVHMWLVPNPLPALVQVDACVANGGQVPEEYVPRTMLAESFWIARTWCPSVELDARAVGYSGGPHGVYSV